MKWTRVSGHGLRWKSWGDESVVYNEASGDTHLLGPAATHILSMLSDTAPQDLDAVAERLASLWQTDNDSGWAQSVHDILNDLLALSLVKTV